MDEQVRCSTAGPAWDHLIKQPRLVLAEKGAHSGARVAQHHGGTRKKRNCHLVDPARRHLQEVAKSVGASKTHNISGLSLRCGSYWTIPDWRQLVGRKHRNRGGALRRRGAHDRRIQRIP